MNIKKDKVVVRLDKDHDKYKIALKLINSILVNLGKDEIDDLTKFVDIDREDIIKEVNKESLKAMEKEILAVYSKKGCGFYRDTDTLALNCLRGMMKEIGYTLTNVEKGISEPINGKQYRRFHMIYSIK